MKEKLLILFDRWMDRCIEELNDHRTILNWFYAAAYLALVFFCVVTNKNSQNTAIVTTGGIIGTIFASYVLGSSYEKVQKMKFQKSADEEEKVAGD